MRSNGGFVAARFYTGSVCAYYCEFLKNCVFLRAGGGIIPLTMLIGIIMSVTTRTTFLVDNRVVNEL